MVLEKVSKKEFMLMQIPRLEWMQLNFENFLTNIIISFYPDAKNRPRKHVSAVIVDINPGRLNPEMLEKCEYKDFIAGVPNTTH